MSKISVIIPVYNDEAHIGRSLESVCAQTIASQLEIIIVDDGSSDNSVAVAEKVLESYNMMPQYNLVKHESNFGVAKARKSGLDAAEGDYVLYCDSDDYMDVDMCGRLLEKAESERYDVVICDYKSIRNGEVSIVDNCYRENFLRELILCHCTGSLWNKLISTRLLKSPTFKYPDNDFSEDYVYSLQVAIYAKKIGYVPLPLYNYDHREGSIVGSATIQKQEKRNAEDRANWELDLQILKDNNLLDEFREEIIAHKLKMKNSNRTNLKFWRKTFPELTHEIFSSRYVSTRSRITYFIRLFGLYKNLK